MKKVMSDQALADLRQRLDRAYVTRDRDELNKILVITEWLSQLTPSPLIRLIAASAESAVAMNSATNLRTLVLGVPSEIGSVKELREQGLEMERSMGSIVAWLEEVGLSVEFKQ